ncbi:MAG: fumarylacetoacetate hydrolase family protein [Pseudomonadota bacterium]
MRYVSFEHNGVTQLGVREPGGIRAIGAESIEALLARGVDLRNYGAGITGGALYSDDQVRFLPPLARPPKIICIGLNFAEHTKESNYEQPTYPTVFLRLHTSLIGHREDIIRPIVSDSLDYEGEIAVVLGKGGRHIKKIDALDHVAGYALFNDASVREFQFKTPQWTVGKNFDGTGAFGPDLVTVDELPEGAKGLRLDTRLNGVLVQSANTDDMVFDVASLISIVSQAFTLEAGDVIVAGTPSGIGWAREPKLLMRAGDLCEVSVEGLGTLSNRIADERLAA